MRTWRTDLGWTVGKHRCIVDRSAGNSSDLERSRIAGLSAITGARSSWDVEQQSGKLSSGHFIPNRVHRSKRQPRQLCRSSSIWSVTAFQHELIRQFGQSDYISTYRILTISTNWIASLLGLMTHFPSPLLHMKERSALTVRL